MEMERKLKHYQFNLNSGAIKMFSIEINELLVAFSEEIGGGAKGIVQAVLKFGKIITWFIEPNSQT